LKKRRLRAVAGSRGVIAALAIDQRSAMQKLFAKAMNVEPSKVPAERTVQFKEAVSRILKFSGVLCGRATWQDGVPVFVKDGVSGLQGWLLSTGVQNIENVNRCLKAAHPWFASPQTATIARPQRKKGKARV
jgi:tagatose-1,6-bisphosphate aldolase